MLLLVSQGSQYKYLTNFHISYCVDSMSFVSILQIYFCKALINILPLVKNAGDFIEEIYKVGDI